MSTLGTRDNATSSRSGKEEMAMSAGGKDASTATARTGISDATAIIRSSVQGTALERSLCAVTRRVKVTDTIKADVVISGSGGACAFQIHINFSHGHVTEAVQRAEVLAASFETCYVLLVRPNMDALRNFQLQLSPACDARPLLVASEEGVAPEIERVSEGVLNLSARSKRKEYYKQVHERLRLDQPHRGILAELLRGLGVRSYEQEADLLLDAFGSIRGICLQPLSALLADCPVAGETARTLHAFFNEKPAPPLPCAMCPGAEGGVCRLLQSLPP